MNAQIRSRVNFGESAFEAARNKLWGTPTQKATVQSGAVSPPSITGLKMLAPAATPKQTFPCVGPIPMCVNGRSPVPGCPCAVGPAAALGQGSLPKYTGSYGQDLIDEQIKNAGLGLGQGVQQRFGSDAAGIAGGGLSTGSMIAIGVAAVGLLALIGSVVYRMRK